MFFVSTATQVYEADIINRGELDSEFIAVHNDTRTVTDIIKGKCEELECDYLVVAPSGETPALTLQYLSAHCRLSATTTYCLPKCIHDSNDHLITSLR